MLTRAPLIVGRDAELSAVTGAMARAREQRRGGAVFLVGEAGIGKSRLAVEAADRATASGMRVLRGRSSVIGPTVPFRPLTEALMSAIRNGVAPDPSSLGAYQPVLGRLVPDWHDEAWRESGPHIGSVVVLAEAVLRFVAEAGREHGSLLVLEDLHDADEETLSVVEYLVDNLDGQPALLLATTRSETGHALDLVRTTARRPGCDVLQLSRLTGEETRLLVAQCLDSTPAQVPEEVAEHLWEGSAGNPFVVEELLQPLVSGRTLVRAADGWRLTADLRTEVPPSLIRSIGDRAARVGPVALELLSIAALFGHRFSLPVVRQALAADDVEALSQLQACVEADLIAPDEPAPEWYSFRHPMIAEALLARLSPMERAQLSRRAATAVEAVQPGLPGDWGRLMASLLLDSGDPAGAAALLADAGRRALADGAAGSAVALLERAERLLSDPSHRDQRAEALASLIPALGEVGRFDQAFQLMQDFDQLADAGLEPSRRIDLHTALARVALTSGRYDDGIAQVDAARALLGSRSCDALSAPIDTVAAYLALDAARPDSTQVAERLAQRAVEAATRASLPDVAAQAYELLGVLARERNLAEATEYFDHALRLAEEHRLPFRRIYALIRLGGTDWLASGDTGTLRRTRLAAQRVGAVNISNTVDAILALQDVFLGEFASAAERFDELWPDVVRLKQRPLARYVLMTRATLAAHQGDRRTMEQLLDDFEKWDGLHSQEQPLSLGLARAFCALLEEDEPRAYQELTLAMASEDEHPNTFHLAGRYGLRLLLGVLRGEYGWPRYREISSETASGMRWNRQFVLLAEAVLLGRDGRLEEAVEAMARAQRLAAPYAMVRNLGLRLVAPSAHADGWGDPVEWLRQAEEYFHTQPSQVVASACRTLLRQLGASVRQRRDGSDRIPQPLRLLGITSREYEVLETLTSPLSNKAIANRLHISPRTVEKHVASLLMKTGRGDRAGLNALALTVVPTADRD